MKTISFSFPYSIYDGETLVANEIANVDFDKTLLEKVSEKIMENGGHAMEIPDIEPLQNAILEEAYSCIMDHFPNGCNADNVYIVLEDEFPDELMSHLEMVGLVPAKNVEIEYAYTHDGQRKTAKASFSLTTESFNAMKAVICAGTDDVWGSLRSSHPKAYGEVIDYVTEIAYKEGVRDEDKPRKNPEPLDFPYQLYLSI